MWQILNGVWPEVGNTSSAAKTLNRRPSVSVFFVLQMRHYRPRNTPSPWHSLTFTTVTKTARNQITLVITGINQKQEPIESEPTIDCVVLWDNLSWNWAAYLLISDSIRVNASSLFFICVLKISLLKVLKRLQVFFCFLFLFEVWNVSPSSCSCLTHVASAVTKWVLFWKLFHASAAMLLFWKAEKTKWVQSPWKEKPSEAVWFTNSVQVDFPERHGGSAVHPSSWLHPSFPPIAWWFEEV